MLHSRDTMEEDTLISSGFAIVIYQISASYPVDQATSCFPSRPLPCWCRLPSPLFFYISSPIF